MLTDYGRHPGSLSEQQQLQPTQWQASTSTSGYSDSSSPPLPTPTPPHLMGSVVLSRSERTTSR
jgi:hypothetical protein